MKKGFTLLEVLLAIVLLTTGAVFLLQALSTGLVASADSENNLIATNLAQEKMEEVRNENYAGIVNETKAVVSGFPAYQREVVVITPQDGLKQVTVNVYWTTKADELNISLVTYISDST